MKAWDESSTENQYIIQVAHQAENIKILPGYQ